MTTDPREAALADLDQQIRELSDKLWDTAKDEGKTRDGGRLRFAFDAALVAELKDLRGARKVLAKTNKAGA